MSQCWVSMEMHAVCVEGWYVCVCVCCLDCDESDLCGVCADSKACWSVVGARLSGGATAHVCTYLLLMALAAHAIVSIAFPSSACQPINRQPLRDGFITIHNGWMVALAAKTKCQNSNVQLLISFNLPSAAVLQHQVALERKSHVGVSFQTTRRRGRVGAEDGVQPDQGWRFFSTHLSIWPQFPVSL